MTLAQKRIALYARFSSDRQSAASVEDQLARCTKWVAERGGNVRPEHVFADRAVSAASMSRPGWTALERAIGSGSIDTIVVESLDRVSRKTGDTMQLIERLKFAGITLHAIADGLDTSTRSAKMHGAFKGLMSDMFLDDLADKTKRGMEGRARAGKSTGGLPYGYRSRATAAGFEIEIDPTRAPIVRRIFTRYAAGASRNQIAADLNREGIPGPRSSRRDSQTANTWQQTSVRAVLMNETYLGRTTWNRREWRKEPGTNRRTVRERPRSEWVVTERPDLRIGEDAVWLACSTKRASEGGLATMTPAERRGTGRRSYLLSSLLRCGVCKSLMAIHGGGTYYRCSSASDRGTCSNRVSFREELARVAFLGAVRDQLSSPELIASVRETIAEVLREESSGASIELERRRALVGRIEAKLSRLVDALADGASATIAAKLREVEEEGRKERAAIRALEQAATADDLPSVDEVLAEWDRLDILLEGTDIRAAREALRGLLPTGSIIATPRGREYFLETEIRTPLVVPAAFSDQAFAGTRLTHSRAFTTHVFVEIPAARAA